MHKENNFRLVLFISLILIFKASTTVGQDEVYISSKTAFSLDAYEEFSPSFYNEGLVFCSNRANASTFSFQNDSKSFISLFFIEPKGTDNEHKVGFFSTELTTQLNDGPATFSENGNAIYYSRNLNTPRILKQKQEGSNQLGIFMSVQKDGAWMQSEPFPFNNPAYSLKSPSVNKSNNRLFFSSNQPGGYGGMDLYYSDFIDNRWQKPVNLGPEINTAEDEVFPFIAEDGKLFFSSKGHGGFGGLDVFYTQEVGAVWINPVHLEASINSSADDFGLITKDSLSSGYFSTNRLGSDDVFQFTKKLIQFDNCVEQKENKFCYQFFDDRMVLDDSLTVIYEWDFGNDVKIVGSKVKYCFPQEGSYSVTLRIMNSITGDTINVPEPYSFELKNHEQAFIASEMSAFVGESIEFNAIVKDFPHTSVDVFYWDFGEGFSQTGDTKLKAFTKEGEYLVKLGLVGTLNNMDTAYKNCVYKTVIINKNTKAKRIRIKREKMD